VSVEAPGCRYRRVLWSSPAPGARSASGQQGCSDAGRSWSRPHAGQITDTVSRPNCSGSPQADQRCSAGLPAGPRWSPPGPGSSGRPGPRRFLEGRPAGQRSWSDPRALAIRVGRCSVAACSPHEHGLCLPAARPSLLEAIEPIIGARASGIRRGFAWRLPRWSTHAHLPADTFSSTVQLVHQPLGASVALRWRRERVPMLRGHLGG
jgi:hypothetical protein